MRNKKLWISMGKNKWNGYMTVEASMLIPMALFLIMLLLYFGFYCFDYCASIQNGYVSALRASNQWEADSSMRQQYARQQWEQLTDRLFIALDNKKVLADTKGNTVEMQIAGNVENLFDFVPINEVEELSFSITAKATVIHPAGVVRRSNIWRD